MTSADPLGERLAALANINDTSDWSDVQRRAQAFELPRRSARRRIGGIALAAILVLPAAAAGAAGVGLGGPFGGLFGDEPEKNFRYHDGQQIPIYFDVRPASSESGGRASVNGKVWMAGVESLELRLSDGETAAVPLDDKGFFRYQLPRNRTATALIARNAQGDAVYTMTIPPAHLLAAPHATNAHGEAFPRQR